MIRTNKVQFDCLKFIEHWQTVQEISRATERAVNSCTMTMTTLIAQGRAESRIVPNEDRSHGAPYKTKAYRRTQAGTEAVADRFIRCQRWGVDAAALRDIPPIVDFYEELLRNATGGQMEQWVGAVHSVKGLIQVQGMVV